MNRSRCTHILSAATKTKILVVGDIMFDHFVWGRATRISPEAPIPVVDLARESFMPGGAANVAYNVSSLGGEVSVFGKVGKDVAGVRLKKLLHKKAVNVQGLIASQVCQTTVKMRIVCGHQQIVRLDRETNTVPRASEAGSLLLKLEAALDRADAVIVGDYGKGLVSQRMLDRLRRGCCKRGVWLSLDPKPSHALDLRGLSFMTPNRREAFLLADLSDTTRHSDPMLDSQLLCAATKLLEKLQPKVLLLTLGELGMQYGASMETIPH